MITSEKKKLSVSQMTKIAMLSVLAFVLMQIELIVPIFPAFLKIDISDLPALIGAFAMGPLAGVAIEAVKNLLHLLQTSTGGVGELANFVVGIAIVVPAAVIYKRHKTKKSAIIGLAVGTLVMAMVGGLANYYVMLPFYSNFMPLEAIIGMGAAVNKSIVSMETLVLYGIVPFNLFKGVVLSFLTLLLYKRISPILHR
ncbi:ECF transporter S component [Fusibacter tunisiensis]|uniref:Riboflavin transporter n=1 Tax=Fusibacter tunisiensis TaxID=1008308 RepID=A0ABS2MSE9_9FIRM|nr:ECF transporter S component [Fusibacter tunisiensis]MBM7562335.1 riboflavin transporter FmnP [Fusibacter tunisiensis]